MINFNKLLAVLAVATSVMLSNGPAMSYMKKDIVGTAVDAGSFTTLVTALKSAGLVDVLKGDGPFTVFAPTDEAFKALPEGTVADLLKPENKAKLISILTYHVVPGKTVAADLTGKKVTVKTVEGSPVKINGTNGVKVNEASVVKPDIMTSNGVIHVINKVILPN